MSAVPVQSVSAAGTAVDSITTGGITTTTGNLVVLDCYFYKTGFFSSVSDNGSANSWTNSVADHTYAAGVVSARQYYNPNINGKAGHTFTLTMSAGAPGGNFPTLAVTEISGQAASPFDVSAIVDDSSGTTHTTASTGTLAQANNLVLGMGGAGQTATVSVSSPWTQLENISNDGNREGIVTAYQNVSATAALTFAYTTSNSVVASGHITVWKEAAGGGTFLPQFANQSGKFIGVGIS